MTRRNLSRGGVCALFLLWAVPGCGSDPTEPPEPREPRVILIPIDMSLEEAADSAAAGDTLEITAVPFPLAATVEFGSDQTPLVLRGGKNLPRLSGLGDFALLRFLSPKQGTRLKEIGFSGGRPSLEVTGAGNLLVESCQFFGGESQVSGAGDGLTLELRNNLLRQASGRSVEVRGGADLVAVNNTIHMPADAGIALAQGSEGTIQNCIVHQAGVYGLLCEGGAVLSDSSRCNNVFGSGTGDYMGCEVPSADFQPGVSPQFCDPDGGDFTLQADSPCAPVNSGGCGLVGALPPSPCDIEAGP